MLVKLVEYVGQLGDMGGTPVCPGRHAGEKVHIGRQSPVCLVAHHVAGKKCHFIVECLLAHGVGFGIVACRVERKEFICPVTIQVVDGIPVSLEIGNTGAKKVGFIAIGSGHHVNRMLLTIGKDLEHRFLQEPAVHDDAATTGKIFKDVQAGCSTQFRQGGGAEISHLLQAGSFGLGQGGLLRGGDAQHRIVGPALQNSAVNKPSAQW